MTNANPGWKPSWTNFTSPPAAVRSESHEWIFQLAQQGLGSRSLLEGGKPPLRVGAAGPTSNPNVYLEFREKMESIGATLVEEALYAFDDDFEEVYAWEEGAAFVTTADENTAIGINLVTTNVKFFEEIREFMAKNILRAAPTNDGRVHILVQGADGISPQALGFAAVPLMLEHYKEDIRASITQLVEDIKNPFPDGRLTILEGPPGCGKTFLIRSLVHELPSTNFVFVPPALVQSLGDPQMVQALIKMNRDNGNAQTTVLICEDADSILTKRAADNMSSISSVLNLSSGILGDVADVRVMATTNASKSDIDPALLRPGRLGQYIKVAPIPRAQATRVLKLLVEESKVDAEQDSKWPAAKVPSLSKTSSVGFSSSADTEIPDSVLLADVFKEAKKLGWTPAKAKAKVASTKIIPRRTRSWATK